MDILHLIFAYVVFFIIGTVVGALCHQKVLNMMGRFYAFIRTWFTD